ncbi:nucleoside hydrolase [Celeribacter indicus]|uniref:Inosine/uridine-preferring nucleoside hydrolase n=1 Tax=Celeribacter indicus TaxID=1208324 RepID=A0A0B5DWP1_9RHOB|nr:nucleoside hydrolase [Celeribacter indicus]AJE47843.1 inosine/uridine-preferring nucleoside hydrolase [Celeribacter indicus]SDW24661.1 Inosine-uridine nucleoside N-ribohydrolase [Celeribacter indicus]
MSVWIDTDYGFDDLWAILLLRRAGVAIDGVSLVSGNATLEQVIANALGAARAYDLDIPLHVGADRPLHRPVETARRILGPRGMQSRGRWLPEATGPRPPDDAVPALAAWLRTADGPRDVLALGPLTNLARLIEQEPEAASRISRLVWMGGSTGPGNHSARAEFNALADPEALARVAQAGIPFDIVDLMFCRGVSFGPQDMPDCDPLTADLLGGYLDIGLSRGRPGMAIYDPVAAFVLARPEAVTFEPRHLEVATDTGEAYGETRFSAPAHPLTPLPPVRLATGTEETIARYCLDALKKED